MKSGKLEDRLKQVIPHYGGMCGLQRLTGVSKGYFSKIIRYGSSVTVEKLLRIQEGTGLIAVILLEGSKVVYPPVECGEPTYQEFLQGAQLNGYVGRVIEHYLLLRGMLQAELAKSSGVSKGSISQVKRGRNMGVCNLEKVTRSLKLGVEYLVHPSQIDQDGIFHPEVDPLLREGIERSYQKALRGVERFVYLAGRSLLTPAEIEGYANTLIASLGRLQEKT